MIYEINGKIYIKVENFYAEVELKYGRLIPIKNSKKLYASQVNKEKIKEYSLNEYSKKRIKEN